MILTIYCKSHNRRPIRFGYAPFSRDRQGDIPVAWCSRCGSEIFDRGLDLCCQCRDRKGAISK